MRFENQQNHRDLEFSEFGYHFELEIIRARKFNRCEKVEGLLGEDITGKFNQAVVLYVGGKRSAPNPKEPSMTKKAKRSRFVELESGKDVLGSGDEQKNHDEDPSYDKREDKDIKGLISSEDFDPASENQRVLDASMVQEDAEQSDEETKELYKLVTSKARQQRLLRKNATKSPSDRLPVNIENKESHTPIDLFETQPSNSAENAVNQRENS